MNHGATVRMKIGERKGIFKNITGSSKSHSWQIVPFACLPQFFANPPMRSRGYFSTTWLGWATWLALISGVRGSDGVSVRHISASSLTLCLHRGRKCLRWREEAQEVELAQMSSLASSASCLMSVTNTCCCSTEILTLLVTEQYQQSWLTGAAKAGFCNKYHALCSFPNSVISLVTQKWHVRRTFLGGTFSWS